MSAPTEHRFAVCVDNADDEVSLILGKVYPVIRDVDASEDDVVRNSRGPSLRSE